MPEISVIVPIYNSEKYLSKCIEHIQKQSYSDFEVILVDDGSNDGCGIICDYYAEYDNRIKVIHQVNQGQAVARNNGVKEASAEWVVFVDSDDLIHPQMLEILYNIVKSSDSLIGICDLEEGFEPSHQFASNKSSFTMHKYIVNEEVLLKMFKEELVSKYAYWVVCGKIVRKEIVEKYPFTAGRKYEDNAIVFKWLIEAKNICICDALLYFYFVNNDGTTKSRYSITKLDWLWALQEQIDFYKKNYFFRMIPAVTTRYIIESVRAYSNILLILDDIRMAKRLRTKIVLFWIKNERNIQLDRTTKLDLLTIMFPNIMKYLSTIKHFIIRK